MNHGDEGGRPLTAPPLSPCMWEPPNTSLERTPRRGPNLRKACYCGEVEERRRSARYR